MNPQTDRKTLEALNIAANDNAPYPTEVTARLRDLAVLLGRAEARARAAAQAETVANS